MYADDNEGKLVNGATGFSDTLEQWGDHRGELAWVNAFSSDWDTAIQGIKDGALWPYAKELKLYRCPTGLAGEHITYAAMDGVNGLSRSRQETIEDVHWMKNVNAIRRPHSRIVFIDEGWVTPDSFAVNFRGGNQEKWWDDPTVRHGDGTAQSFADGHSDWRKWKGLWTVEYGLATIGIHPQNHYPPGASFGGQSFPPASSADYHDLYWLQKGNWGELGYTPTY